MMYNALRRSLVALSLLSFVGFAQPALAVPTVFFGWDNKLGNVDPHPKSQGKYNRFTGSLSSYGVDDAESQIPFDVMNPVVLSFGATGITAATQGIITIQAPTFDLDDQAYIELAGVFPAPAPQVNTKFTLSEHVNAFGLYVIQGGDSGFDGITVNNNPTTFILRDTDTMAEVTVPVQIGPGWNLNNIFFLGVHDRSFMFDEVEIAESIDVQDVMLYDNIVAGFVPEPSSLAILALGGACALCRTRRVRRS